MSQHIADLISRRDLRIYTDAEIRKIAQNLDWIDPNFDLAHYIPPGNIARRFILSNAQTSVIMGPLGGGKTTACVFKRIYAATRAPIARHPADGKRTRMCRWIVLRDTFRSVEKTVLESWKQWFSTTYPGSSWQGGNDRPAIHTLRFMGMDGIRIEAITEFAGLGADNIETLMKGREYSGSWLNEIDTHAEGSLDDMEQRVGRYPMQELLEDPDAERMKLVIGDMNAPTIDNWTYPTLVTERKPGREFHQQPSGRSENAENRLNLPPDYYDRIVENQPEHFIKRMVDNQFGYSRKGKPVHPTFDHAKHVAPAPIPFDPRLDLLIGIDISTNALTPAAVFGQNDTRRLKIINELWLGHGFGPARFAERLVQLLNEEYPNRRHTRVWIDPAAEHGGDREGGQLAALEILSNALKLPIQVPFGGSNELTLRLAAVDLELRGYMEPDSWLQVSPKCKMLIEALGGRYRFKKTSPQATNEYEDLPEKSHPFSDLCDGAQYLIGGVRGRAGTINAASNEGQGQGGSSSSGNWNRTKGSPNQGGFDPRKTGL